MGNKMIAAQISRAGGEEKSRFCAELRSPSA